MSTLDDPIIHYGSALGTIGAERGYGQLVSLTQRFEWPNKKRLRGESSRLDALASKRAIELVRLDLAQQASSLFNTYYVAHRTLEINREHSELVQRFKKSAEAQYASGKSAQQDALEAEVELAMLQKDQLQIKAEIKVITAQLNSLLHRAPDSILSPPPNRLAHINLSKQPLPAMRASAVQDRPELKIIANQIVSAEHKLTLAELSGYPDLDLTGTYNSMWSHPEHQFMVGLSLTIPIHTDVTQARVDQAHATLLRLKALNQSQRNQITTEVYKARVKLQEAIERMELYRDQLLPAAKRLILASEFGYQSGKGSFSSIMSAEHRLRSFKKEYEEAIAQTWDREANLSRALGKVFLDKDLGRVSP